MTDSSRGYQQFFAELKRRHVFKVAAIYGAVAFGILQVAEPLGTALGLSDSFLSLVVGLLLLGFPVALVLAWAFEVTPEGVQKAEPAAPGEIEAIVAQPASMRWPAGLLALAGAGLLLGGWWMGSRAAPDYGSAADSSRPEARLVFADLADDPRPSIAVLPFVNMSADEDQVYFSDGMTEEILNVLAKIQDLRVAARTSTFALRDRELTAMQWGDTLRVAYLVEGSVRKAGDQVRITAQLIDTSNGSHLWSDNFDRPLANVFQIQSEIAEKIAEALTVPLGLEDGESLIIPTADLEAYDLYLAGRQQMRLRGEGVAEAVQLFEAAIARDSAWAPAWAGLAESWSLIPYYGFPTETDGFAGRDSAYWAQALGSAETAAHRALALDPDNGSALVALGNVYRDSWQWEQAEEAYLKALATDPDNVEAHQQYSDYLYQVGRMEDAVHEAERAVALDRSPIRLNLLGFMSNAAGRHDEGIALLEEGVRLDPEGRVRMLWGNLAAAYFDAGRWQDWWNFRQRFVSWWLENAPDSASRAEFLERDAGLRAAWPEGTPPPQDLDFEALSHNRLRGLRVRVALLLGRHELAMETLEERDEDRPPFGVSELMNVQYDPIRDDPRFQALLARHGLEGRVPQRPEPVATP